MLDALVEQCTATPETLLMASTLLFALGGLGVTLCVFGGPQAWAVIRRSLALLRATLKDSRRKRELDRKNRFACK